MLRGRPQGARANSAGSNVSEGWKAVIGPRLKGPRANVELAGLFDDRACTRPNLILRKVPLKDPQHWPKVTLVTSPSAY
jgi:hypothetical protein